MRIITWLIAAVTMLAVSAGSGEAQVARPAKRPDIKVDLLTGGHDPSDPGTVWLGVRVRLGAGWKTYWRSPGDGGLPSEFDWAQSTNLPQADILWPAPHRMEILGIETIGYTDEVVFPVKARVADPADPARVTLTLGLYACSTICVRDDHTLATTISPGTILPEHQATIDAWRARVPQQASKVLSVASIRLMETTPPTLQVKAKAADRFNTPDLFVESDPPVYGSKPHVEAGPDGTATFTATLEGVPLEKLKGRPFRVTLIDGDQAVEAASGEWATAPGGLPSDVLPDRSEALWATLLAALAGGFILNLMPCVFPVLSLKLLAFVNQGAVQRHTIRLGFTASAAGILVSFLVLASAMVGLKSIGATVGWGIQFQQPVFLALMAAILTLFAANLLGLFEVVLPSRWMDRLDRTGRGSSLGSHFASGFVATLLATPCSAPLVGTAVGFALSRGVFEIYLVFAALGIGMALPYVLVAAVPRLATVLPRPGRWMLTVKRIMALGLLATAAWLLTVVGTIAGALTAFVVATLLASAMAGLWARTRGSGALMAGLLTVTAVQAAAVFWTLGPQASSPADRDAVPWQSLDENKIASLVQDGRTVFVDVTAAWCITCKVNKALVLDDPGIVSRLQSDVVPVQRDWTKPDDRIAAYLQSFGRYGIPFNVVYGPGAPEGIVLPELLSSSSVLGAFDKAAAHNGPSSSTN